MLKRQGLRADMGMSSAGGTIDVKNPTGLLAQGRGSGCCERPVKRAMREKSPTFCPAATGLPPDCCMRWLAGSRRGQSVHLGVMNARGQLTL